MALFRLVRLAWRAGGPAQVARALRAEWRLGALGFLLFHW